MRKNLRPILSLLLSWSCLFTYAQTTDTVDTYQQADFVTLDELNNETIATFKTTRIVNGHTIEHVKAGVLDFRINHRFGRISEGGSNFFGLDNASTRIGFDYGISNHLMVGLGRSTLSKEYDAFLKLRVLSQHKTKSPITISYLAASYIVSEKYVGLEPAFFNRVSYLQQVLIARKFSEKVSLQLMPTYVHFNMTQRSDEKNDVASMGIGGRYKLSKRTALTAEYYYVPDAYKRNQNFNPLSFGLDIETGGHVFQLFLSNASGISERSLFTNTVSQWSKGQIHFGFNISRVFTLKKNN